MLFSPYLFTHMHNSGLTSLFLISSHMHWNTYICSWFLNISYIYFSFKVFLGFLLLGQLLSLKLQHSKTSLKLWHSKTYICWCNLYIYSLVVIHLGNIANHIFCIWFVMLFSPYLFIHMHNSGLTSLFLISCHMHWNTYICSWFLNISYIYFSFKVFLCFLLLGQLLSLKLQHSKTSLKLWHSKTYI